jgi:acyl-CoA thioesterase YciA
MLRSIFGCDVPDGFRRRHLRPQSLPQPRTTVAVDGMAFINPVFVGDIVNCHASLVKVGRTSMKIDVEAWVQRGGDGKLLRDTKGVFTYAAIDDKGRPHPVHRV